MIPLFAFYQCFIVYLRRAGALGVHGSGSSPPSENPIEREIV